ncbi:MAG TPA: response regulator [Cyclobacteriaceae bacterium]|nr:response regulator [Cyclobacteriaceae bacterium]
MTVEKGNILLVDDDEDVLLAAKFLLKRHFAYIDTASSPGDALTLLNNNAFDVVLLDMNYTSGVTTGKEGFDLLKAISTSFPLIRVVMMTAYGDIDLAIKAIKEGATDFIVKPWDNAKLVSTVISAFKKSPEFAEAQAVRGIRKNSEFDVGLSEVVRIFMFLDLRSSTSIAEELGHLKYFELLNDFFNDIAKPIEKNNGEIYQYVGDEVVVSWPFTEGVRDANCLKCFFDIQDTIHGLASRYTERYNVVPEFKAGMHYGKVSTGVIGTVKKEIIYTGDVLNTTSRIEGQCNSYKVNLLISRDLADKIPATGIFNSKKLGEINLRGKSSTIILFTVERKP